MAAEVGLFLLADGVGGAAEGARASSLALETVRDVVVRESRGGSPDPGLLDRAVESANRAVFAIQNRSGGVGTTLVALWADPEGDSSVLIAWVGDSRIYRWRRGKTKRLTEDHCLRNELLRAGLTARGEDVDDGVGSLLTRAVGAEKVVELETAWIESRPGDRYLLCSDGVLEIWGEEDLDALLADPDVDRLLERLVPPEGGPDDASAVVVDVRGMPAGDLS